MAASLAVAREWQDEVPARWTDDPEPWEDGTDAGDATEEDHPEPSPPSAPQRPPKRTAAERDALALAYLRRPQIVKFDTSRHRWREAVCKALGVECGGDGGGGAARWRQRRWAARWRRGTGTPWIRRWKSRAPDVAAEVIAVYVGFVRDVVQARLSRVCAEFGSAAMAGGLLFQREPSFRCHTPSPRPTGRPHTDADYGHQSAELNVWVPVTRASGANSLYAESAPGEGDYAAFDVDYGDAVFFWGNQCRHYTVANDSGAARVSIDCRVLPRSTTRTKRKDGGATAFHASAPSTVASVQSHSARGLGRDRGAGSVGSPSE
ncbi:hypothetical protein JL722_8582 [Aureococcus anophagefferens]|nr:hypothetical protein JL722_8582 [Aureococcus anophagefferens]